MAGDRQAGRQTDRQRVNQLVSQSDRHASIALEEGQISVEEHLNFKRRETKDNLSDLTNTCRVLALLALGCFSFFSERGARG